MNLKPLVITAAVGLFASTTALADPGGVDPTAGFVRAKSRTEVAVELATTRAAGEIRYGEHASEPAPITGSTMTRTQVRAEMLEARRLGLLAWRGDAEPQVPTTQQAEQIRQAGLRASRGELISSR